MYFTDDCWAQGNQNSPKNFVPCDSSLALETLKMSPWFPCRSITTTLACHWHDMCLPNHSTLHTWRTHFWQVVGKGKPIKEKWERWSTPYACWFWEKTFFSVSTHCCCKKGLLRYTKRVNRVLCHTELALFVGFSIRVWVQDYSVVWCTHNLVLLFIYRSDADNPNDVTVRKDHKPARRISSTRQELLTESSSPDWHQEHVEYFSVLPVYRSGLHVIRL